MNAKRIRRTNEAIDKAIYAALKELVKERGFTKITLTELIQKAKMEPNVFYKRYGSLSVLLESYMTDYWHKQIIHLEMEHVQDMKGEVLDEYLLDYLQRTIDTVDKDRIFQKILLWEVGDNDKSSQILYPSRDMSIEPLLKALSDAYDSDDLKFRNVIGIVVGGIYYIVLNRYFTTFAGIDYEKKEDMRILSNTARIIVQRLLLDNCKPDRKALEIASKMKEEQLDSSLISKCTGLSEDIIAGL